VYSLRSSYLYQPDVTWPWTARIEASDRQGLERLLCYCARPAFALDRLREIDAERLVL
jgi:hypothetical protein